MISAGAARAWQEVVEAYRARGNLTRLAELQRRLAGVYELQGAWDRALAARVAAAEAFAERGQEFEAATERLAAASHLQAGASLTTALELVAGSAVERTGSIELRARALSLGAQSWPSSATPSAAWSLPARVLPSRLWRTSASRAADAHYRLASALQVTSRYPEALDAYTAATDFCQQQGIAAWRRSALPAWRR